MFYSKNGKRENDRLCALELGELMTTVIRTEAKLCGPAFSRLARHGVTFREEDRFMGILLGMPAVFDDESELDLAVLGTLEKALQDVRDTFIFSFEGRLFALIRLVGDACSDTESESMICRSMEALLEQPCCSHINVLISGVTKGLVGLAHSAFVCVDRIDFHEFLESPPRLEILRHEPSMLGRFGEDLGAYQQLCNRLAVYVRGDAFSPEKAAREMVGGVVEVCSQNIVPYEVHVHMLALSMTKTAVETGLADADFARNLMDELNLLGGDTETEMIRLAEEYFTRLRRQYLILTHNLVADRMRSIKEYIEENIVAYDLSVTSVSDRYGINRSLLTSQFKRHYGVSLSQYIQSCRVEKAKSLMDKNPNWSMEHVARAAGYSSLSTMYRAFKKQDGVAPGSYRN